MGRHLLSKRSVVFVFCATVVSLLLVGILFRSQPARASAPPPSKAAPADSTAAPAGGSNVPSVELTAGQLGSIQIGKVGMYDFPLDRETVGTIGFADDANVQVFPAYQGTILQTFAELGTDVKKGQSLYTIKSPDLIQAESTLIGAAATFDQTSKELRRVRNLPGVAQKEVEQAIADEQTADGALKAARDAVLVFGKTQADVDRMISSRATDPALIVRSPIDGQITTYNAPPGLLVQPGNPPAPFTVTKVTLKWMLADVVETDIALLHVGQRVEVRVPAYPDHIFRGTISKIYPLVDPNTHRETVRAAIDDPRNALRSGMLASFIIRVKKAKPGIAIPAEGVVREPDGTMTAWVTSDRHRFEQRVVKTGERRDGQVEILDGLRRGEQVVTNGAVFLSNILEAPEAD